jgi:hypothetical protein
MSKKNPAVQAPKAGDLINRDSCFFTIEEIHENLDDDLAVAVPSKAGAIARDSAGNEYPAPERIHVPVSSLRPAGEVGEQTIWS